MDSRKGGERMIDQTLGLAAGFLALALWGGGIYIAFNILCNLWDAHQRGMKRLRAYDQRTAQLNK